MEFDVGVHLADEFLLRAADVAAAAARPVAAGDRTVTGTVWDVDRDDGEEDQSAGRTYQNQNNTSCPRSRTEVRPTASGASTATTEMVRRGGAFGSTRSLSRRRSWRRSALGGRSASARRGGVARRRG